MIRIMIPPRGTTFLAAATAMAVACMATGQAQQDAAARLLEKGGVTGGVIVHLGCGDGEKTLQLWAGDRFIVQGFDADAASVAKARVAIQAEGLYGRVAAEELKGDRLPFVDNFVNLVVADDPGNIGRDEILRVLVPGGACVSVNPRAEILDLKFKKPWPAGMDTWPQDLHGADGNPVSKDKFVGPPKHFQWVDKPEWLRDHNWNPSLVAMVTEGGRIFTIYDEGPIGVIDSRFPERWSLIARDAFNGKLLWKVPLSDWGWRGWENIAVQGNSRDPRNDGGTPIVLPRRLAAAKDRVFVTLKYQAPVTLIDAATGKIEGELPDTSATDEIVLDGDTLYLRVREKLPSTWEGFDEKIRKNLVGKSSMFGTKDRLDLPRGPGRVMAWDLKAGKKKWEHPADLIQPLTLCAAGDRVYYSDFENAVALNVTGGVEAWRVKIGEVPSAVRAGRAQEARFIATPNRFVVQANGSGMLTLDAAALKKGKEALVKNVQYNRDAPSGYFDPGVRNDVLVADNGFIYLYHRYFDRDWKEVPPAPYRLHGCKPMGEKSHMIATGGFLHGSYYNRVYLLHGNMWPGYTNDGDAPASGQLVVFDDKLAYSHKYFLQGKGRYESTFGGNTTELLADPLGLPTIQGPQGGSDDTGREKLLTPDPPDLPKGPNSALNRGNEATWRDSKFPILGRAMVKAGDKLYIAGPPDAWNEKDPLAPYDNRIDSKLIAVEAATGKRLAEGDLKGAPVFDGMAAARGDLFISRVDGSLVCIGK